MDITPDTVYGILRDLGIPATIADLQNPTEAFMMNMCTEFLRQLSIDVDAIKRPLPEQLNALRLTGPENLLILSVINISAVMASIGQEIFLKDFTINDILNPAPKRSRKILKIMANFLLYFQGAKDKMAPKIDEVLKRGQRVSELKDKNQKMIEEMNTKAEAVAKKRATIEALDKEIENATAKLKIGKKIASEKDEKFREVQEKYRKILEKRQSKREELQKLSEKTDQLMKKTVQDPESYQGHLKMLEDEVKDKREKQNTLKEAINSKQKIIDMMEKSVTVIMAAHKQLSETIVINQEVLEQKNALELIKRDIDHVDSTLHSNSEQINDQEIKKYKARCDKQLGEYKTIIDKLIVDKKEAGKTLDNKSKEEIELCVKKDAIQVKIMEKEVEIAKFIQDCQDLVNKDIRAMKERYDNAQNALDELKKK